MIIRWHMRGALSALRTAVWITAAAALAACGGNADTSPAVAPSAPPPTVEILSVAPGDSASAIRASGLLAYKRETALAFGVPGQIETLDADEGDTVHAGQVLAILRKTTASADASEAALARQTAEQNFERINRLHANGAASQVDLDNARLALERARERVSIVAPASGIILRRDAERGQIVPAGQPVLWIGEARTGVVVQATATSAEVSRVTVGDAADVLIRGREPMSGKVARIAAKSAAAGAFEIEVAVDRPEGLRSGEVAEVLIHSEMAGVQPATRFIVPAISLVDARADQGVVFVVDADGKARRRAVETGGVTDKGVVILKGLAEGDRVITRGASMVRDGDPVRLVLASE